MEGDAVYAGKRFGRLTCAEPDDHGMWLCRCDCGGEIRTDAAMLQSGVITSCGCKKSRCLNLKGQRFGHLMVENPIQERAADHSVLWFCRCDCGNHIIASSSQLRGRHTTSCGCGRLDNARRSMTHIDGTCVESLFSGTLFRSNTSGYRGVSLRNGRWQAYITYARKMMRLGSYDTVEEALAARKQAEEQIRRRLESLMADSAEDEVPLKLKGDLLGGAGNETLPRRKRKPAGDAGEETPLKLNAESTAGVRSKNEAL